MIFPSIHVYVVLIIKTTYTLHMMGRLDVKPANTKQLSCIPIGYIFYGMVQTCMANWHDEKENSHWFP